MSDREVEVFNLVEELNAEMYERIGEKMYQDFNLTWAVTSNGYWTGIEFGGMNLWDTENDDRKRRVDKDGEDIDEYEISLKEYMYEILTKLHTLIGKILNPENEQTDL